jgi:hypothetical protein
MVGTGVLDIILLSWSTEIDFELFRFNLSYLLVEHMYKIQWTQMFLRPSECYIDNHSRDPILRIIGT